MNDKRRKYKGFELLGVLRDIGKVAIPDQILEKQSELNSDEWRIMRNHSEIGYRIAASTPELIIIAEPILCHHERWDAMVHDRPYRKALLRSYAEEEIRKNSGTQFDPKIAEIFLNILIENSTYN
jgi:diguanylate cyclase